MDGTLISMHIFKQRVYIEDVDAMGCVYHPNYLKFCERARTEMLKALGFDHSDRIKDKNNFFVIRHIHMDYLMPSYLNDLIEITTILTHLSAASIVFIQNLYVNTTLIGRFEAKLVCVDNTFKAHKIPNDLRMLLKSIIVLKKQQ